MNFFSQNLNESPPSMFWHGRAWYRRLRTEWLFGKHARMFHFSVNFGVGDGDDGLQLSISIPWLFGIYVTLDGVYRCKEKELGVSIHDNTIWFKTFSSVNEWIRSDPWWKKGFSWDFPWKTRWHSTEILEHAAKLPAKVVYTEKKMINLGPNYRRDTELKSAAEESVTEKYPYTYKLKNGEVQHCTASVFVDRMTWRARWYPVIPIERSKTCINISFDQEVGEGAGSWKGGVLGCGYEMKPGETPLETLRRMEVERRFER